MEKLQNQQIAAITSYIIIGMIWYLIDDEIKKSKLVKFHVKQALNIFIISFIFSILSSLIITPSLLLLASIPYFGFVISGILSLIVGAVGIALLLLWIIGIIFAFEKKSKSIPIIGKLAQKYLKF